MSKFLLDSRLRGNDGVGDAKTLNSRLRGNFANDSEGGRVILGTILDLLLSEEARMSGFKAHAGFFHCFTV
jgi:hypothetical protein